MTANPVPDFFEPLVGWRCWGHLRQDGYIRSLAMGFYWVPGKPIQVRCSTCGAASKPAMDNGQGIHAFKTLAELVRQEQHSSIVGSVYLWGTIVVCEHGYRAEFAYPKSLLVPDEWHANIIRTHWKGVTVEVGNAAELYKTALRNIALKSNQTGGV